jgi:hypothetical protein
MEQNSMNKENPTKRIGNAYIEAAYLHLREHGSATQAELCDLTGACYLTFSSARIMRINELMRDRGYGHLFVAGTQAKTRAVIWSLRERKVRV